MFACLQHFRGSLHTPPTNKNSPKGLQIGNKQRVKTVPKIFSDEVIDYWFYYGPLFVAKQPNIQLQKNNIFALLF